MSEWATVRDLDALTEWLNVVNYDHGQIPETVGFDNATRPVVVWLNEDGGDSTLLCAALLSGESAERSDVAEVDPASLSFPLRLVVRESWPEVIA